MLAVIRIETGGVMPEEANSDGRVGLMNISAMTIGAEEYDLDRAAVDPAYSIEIGTLELALRYLDSGKLPWRNVVVGYFAGHYEPDGSARRLHLGLRVPGDRFVDYFAILEAAASCGAGGGDRDTGGHPGDWLAGVGQPIDGLAYLWGGVEAR